MTRFSQIPKTYVLCGRMDYWRTTGQVEPLVRQHSAHRSESQAISTGQVDK